MLILLHERLGLPAMFTTFCILFYNKLNLCTQCTSPFERSMLCFCMGSYRISFRCFTFYSFSTDLLKNISVQRPQKQCMFCLDTGQNVLTNKYAVCLLKPKLGSSISLYLKVIELMKSKRQQTDKLMFNSISSGKDTGLTIYGPSYYSDTVWEKRQHEPQRVTEVILIYVKYHSGTPTKTRPTVCILRKKIH